MCVDERSKELHVEVICPISLSLRTLGSDAIQKPRRAMHMRGTANLNKRKRERR